MAGDEAITSAAVGGDSDDEDPPEWLTPAEARRWRRAAAVFSVDWYDVWPLGDAKTVEGERDEDDARS